jgi:predicted DNA-binding ribbon-helix-helix protein
LSGIVKRSVVIAGHRTSVSLEEPFWRLLKSLAAREGLSVAAMIGRIDSERRGVNLSSAIRVALLEDMMQRSEISIDP